MPRTRNPYPAEFREEIVAYGVYADALSAATIVYGVSTSPSLSSSFWF